MCAMGLEGVWGGLPHSKDFPPGSSAVSMAQDHTVCPFPRGRRPDSGHWRARHKLTLTHPEQMWGDSQLCSLLDIKRERGGYLERAGP